MNDFDGKEAGVKWKPVPVEESDALLGGEVSVYSKPSESSVFTFACVARE